jgi:chromosome partitioning protein
MAKIITLANQKGGVAKTTTSLALASGLTNHGYHVLGVDLDPQSNFSLSSGIDTVELDETLYDVFKRTTDANSVLLTSPLGYDVLPGGLSLAGADMDFTQTGREYMLKEALEALDAKYDYIIIDTPPTLGILTTNAMAASDSVIVPMAADLYSIQGLSQLNGLISNVRKYCNQNLKLAGLLITKYHGNQNISKAVSEKIAGIAQELNTKVFKATIRESVAIREAQLLHSDIFKDAPKANATVDYAEFINELLKEEN